MSLALVALCATLSVHCGPPAVSFDLTITLGASVREQVQWIEISAEDEDSKAKLLKPQLLAVKNGVPTDSKQGDISIRIKSKSKIHIYGRGLDAAKNKIAYGQQIIDTHGDLQNANSRLLFLGSSDQFETHPFSSQQQRAFSGHVTLPNGVIWFAGGLDLKTGTALNTTEYFDPVSCRFYPGPSLPIGVVQPMMTSVEYEDDTYIVVLGGYGINGASRSIPLSYIYVFSSSNDTHVEVYAKNLLEVPRAEAMLLTLAPNRFALIGGKVSERVTSAFEVLSFESPDSVKTVTNSVFGTNLTKVSAPFPVAGTLIDYKPDAFLILGGLQNKRIFRVDPQTGDGAEIGQLVESRPFAASIYRTADTVFALAGGATAIERFNLVGASPATTVGYLPDLRTNPQVTALDGTRLLVSGGDLVSEDGQNTNQKMTNNIVVDYSGSFQVYNNKYPFKFSRRGHDMIRTQTGLVIAVHGSVEATSAEILSLPF